jgi:hypothetical protein
MRKLLLTLVFAAFATGLLFAADPSGNWKASVDGPDGNKTDMVFEIKVTNGGVVGTVLSAMGEMHIIEGKVDGDKIEFVVEFGDFRIPHKGTFTATEMKLESNMMEQKYSLVLKKT